MPPVSRVCELCGIGFWDSSPGSIKRRYCAVCEHLPAGAKRINMELRAASDPARESRIKAVLEAHRRLKGDKLATDEEREQVYHDREDALDALAAGEVKHD